MGNEHTQTAIRDALKKINPGPVLSFSFIHSFKHSLILQNKKNFYLFLYLAFVVWHEVKQIIKIQQQPTTTNGKTINSVIS